MDLIIQEKLKLYNPDDYALYLSPSRCFRYDIYPDYKKSRQGKSKHVMFAAVKDYLISGKSYYEVCIEDNIEADDLLGIHQTKAWEHGVDTCIDSIDKDLKMIPGSHTLEDGMFIFLTGQDCFKFFCRQMVTGDSSDCIPGIKGKGVKAAEKIFKGIDIEDMPGMWDAVRKAYDKFSDYGTMNVMGQLLWIQRYGYQNYWDYIEEL